MGRTRLPRLQRCVLLEVAAVEQLHGVERPFGVDRVVVHLDHARMRELCERMELAFEER